MRKGRARGRWVAIGALALCAVGQLAHGDIPAGPAPPRPKNPERGRTVVVKIEGEIDLGLAPYVERVLATTDERDTVILDINTFGGRLDAGVQIRDAILNARANTVAFVDKRAISAGALIALAADAIVMAPGATIGAATPVTLEGTPGNEKMSPVDAKVVSYMRKEMKATAEAKHRRSDVAEAMVDTSVVIEGLDDEDHLLTLTSEEAARLGIASNILPSLAALVAWLGVEEPDRIGPGLNWAERAARFLSEPSVSSLLMTLGLLGILIELWAPGHAVAGVTGVACLILFFFGHYVVHLAGWGEILLFAVGVAAVIYEVFYWPGHGALAVAGVLMILTSLTLALIGLRTVPFDVSIALGVVAPSLARVFGSVMIVALAMVVVTRFLPKTRFGRPLVLQTAITANAGAAHAQTDEHGPLADGAVGIAETPLRPAGKVLFAGHRFDVVTDGEFLEAGTEVVLASQDGARIVVKRKNV